MVPEISPFHRGVSFKKNLHSERTLVNVFKTMLGTAILSSPELKRPMVPPKSEMIKTKKSIVFFKYS